MIVVGHIADPDEKAAAAGAGKPRVVADARAEGVVEPEEALQLVVVDPEEQRRLVARHGDEDFLAAPVVVENDVGGGRKNFFSGRIVVG